MTLRISCDDLVGWSVDPADSGTIEIDTVNKVEGTGSILWTAAPPPLYVSSILCQFPIQDWSKEPVLRLRFNPSLITARQNIEFILIAELEGVWHAYSYGIIPLNQGEWNEVSVDLRNAVAGTPDLTAVRALRFNYFIRNDPVQPTCSVDWIETLPLPPERTISGVITDGETGAPIEGVTVIADGYEATSLVDGSYSLFVAAVVYTVTFTKEGYEPREVPNVDCTVYDVTLNVQLQPVVTSTIQGYVTDAETGNPINGARVDCNGYVYITAPDGFYQFQGILAKVYTVTVSAAGYGTETLTVDASAGGTFPRDVALTPAPPPPPFPTEIMLAAIGGLAVLAAVVWWSLIPKG